MSVGYIICTRTDSSRLPNKPFRKINGVPVLELLIKRLQKTGIPIFIAYPVEQDKSYRYLGQFYNVWLYPSTHGSDPLQRMYRCASEQGLDTIIRVSHDKIFVEPEDVKSALEAFKGQDYLYGSFIPGSGFEILGFKALEKAAQKYKDVEYIGYAVRSESKNVLKFKPRHPIGNYRFLIDYEYDLQLLEVILSQLGNDCGLHDAIKYLDDNPELKRINSNPILTVYTCAYNASAYIQETMESVERQNGFKSFEYIIIDDHSTDDTPEKIAKFAVKHKNVTWIRNDKNKGLASSSNLALKHAKGKYILRLDADDYFISPHALSTLVREIEDRDVEVIYPDNYFGNMTIVQKGNEKHHAGGTIFDKNAITYIKFTDGLTDFDSLDIFLRAKDQLKIGYLEAPMFFYRQRSDSMSRTNQERRKKIERSLQVDSWALEVDEMQTYFEGPDEVRKLLI